MAGQRVDRTLAVMLSPGLAYPPPGRHNAGEMTVDGRAAKPGQPWSWAAHPDGRRSNGRHRWAQFRSTAQGRSTLRFPSCMKMTRCWSWINRLAWSFTRRQGMPAARSSTRCWRMCPTIAGGGAGRPGIVHRLDKDTSGLMVVAKDPTAHAALAEQMHAHQVIKRYLTLVEGSSIQRRRRHRGTDRARFASAPAHGHRLARRGRACCAHALPCAARGARTYPARSATRDRPHASDSRTLGRHRSSGRGRSHLRAPQPPQPPRQFSTPRTWRSLTLSRVTWLSFDSPLPHDLAAFLAQWEQSALR